MKSPERDQSVLLTEDVPYPTSFPVMIRSNEFHGNVVRMAGVQDPQPNAAGFGTVNCQADMNDIGRNPWEIFNAVRNTGDGTISFESQAFPSNFLRMEGVPNPQPEAAGFGLVNCQSYVGPYEQFNVSVLNDDTANGVLVSIESTQFPSNFLRLAGENPPVFNGNGFGTVNCQSYVGPYEKFHLATILHDGIDELLQWFPQSPPPTQEQIDELIVAIITAKPIQGAQLSASAHPLGFLALTDDERARIDAVNLDDVSPCTLAVATFCIDALIFFMMLMGIRIMRTDQMVRAAVAALGTEVSALERTIAAIGAASTRLNQAGLLFGFINQLMNISFIKAVIKTLVSGFSWFGAVVAAVTFIAQVAAWVATDGTLLIAQIVLAGAALAALITDAIKVSNTCSSATTS